MTDGGALVNIGELSKPATVLIEKISDAIGGIAKPYQMRRVARAEADAAMITVTAQIEITELYRRAGERFITEEAKKQENIESITAKSIPLLEEKAQPQNIEDDWITNFFDKSRLISDNDMQNLWSRVLAGEANSPGKFSKRTVNLLSSLDKSDALLFTKFCGFCWFAGILVPLIYDVSDSIYTSQGITFDALTHLDDLGLLNFNSITGYRLLNFPKMTTMYYYGTPVNIEFGGDEINDLKVGKVLLSKVGKELAPISASKPVNGFFDYILEKWLGMELLPSSPYPKK